MTRMLVNGVRLETRVRGAGEPVILLHGFTGRGATWAAHVPALAHEHRVIVVDLLGHGRSDAPTDPRRYATDCQAADIAALLETVGAAPADVVGYSMGARIALRLALDHPLAVRRLVLESPSAGFLDPVERDRRRQADEALAAVLERDGLEAFVDRWEAQPVFASHHRLSVPARRRLRAQRMANRPAALAATLRGAGQGVAEPVLDELGRVRAPTLVVCGELDRVGSERGRLVAGRLPNARLEVVGDAGHTPHLEQSARFRDLLIDFLETSRRINREPPPIA